MKTIDSYNVIIVDVKMPWLLTQSCLLPLRVTRALAGFQHSSGL